MLFLSLGFRAQTGKPRPRTRPRAPSSNSRARLRRPRASRSTMARTAATIRPVTAASGSSLPSRPRVRAAPRVPWPCRGRARGLDPARLDRDARAEVEPRGPPCITPRTACCGERRGRVRLRSCGRGRACAAALVDRRAAIRGSPRRAAAAAPAARRAARSSHLDRPPARRWARRRRPAPPGPSIGPAAASCLSAPPPSRARGADPARRRRAPDRRRTPRRRRTRRAGHAGAKTGPGARRGVRAGCRAGGSCSTSARNAAVASRARPSHVRSSVRWRHRAAAGAAAAAVPPPRRRGCRRDGLAHAQSCREGGAPALKKPSGRDAWVGARGSGGERVKRNRAAWRERATGSAHVRVEARIRLVRVVAREAVDIEVALERGHLRRAEAVLGHDVVHEELLVVHVEPRCPRSTR